MAILHIVNSHLSPTPSFIEYLLYQRGYDACNHPSFVKAEKFVLAAGSTPQTFYLYLFPYPKAPLMLIFLFSW